MRVGRMGHQRVGGLAGERRHLGTHRAQEEGDLGVLDGAGIEEGLQAVEPVVLSLEAEGATLLEAAGRSPAATAGTRASGEPAVSRACRSDRRCCPGPARPGPARSVPRHRLEIPGCVRHRHRTARKGDQHGDGDLEPSRRIERHRRHQQAVVHPVGHAQSVVAERLRAPGLGAGLRRSGALIDRRVDPKHLCASRRKD